LKIARHADGAGGRRQGEAVFCRDFATAMLRCVIAMKRNCGIVRSDGVVLVFGRAVGGVDPGGGHRLKTVDQPLASSASSVRP